VQLPNPTEGVVPCRSSSSVLLRLCWRLFTIGCRPVNWNARILKRRNIARRRRWAMTFGISALIAPLAAQGAPPAEDSSLEFTFTPGVYVTRLAGTSRLGPSPAARSLTLEDAFNLDATETPFNLEVGMVKNGLWELDFSGFDFSTENSGAFAGHEQFGSLSLNPGDRFNAEFDLTSFAAEFTYWPWAAYRIGEMRPGGECHVTLHAGPSAGVRYFNIEQSVEVPTVGRDSGKGEWLVPFAGLQFEMRYEPPSAPLIHALEIDAAFGVGPALGGDGGFMAQLRAGITLYFTPNFGAGFGYRLVQLDAENGDFEVDASLQGLVFHAIVRF